MYSFPTYMVDGFFPLLETILKFFRSDALEQCSCLFLCLFYGLRMGSFNNFLILGTVKKIARSKIQQTERGQEQIVFYPLKIAAHIKHCRPAHCLDEESTHSSTDPVISFSFCRCHKQYIPDLSLIHI